MPTGWLSAASGCEPPRHEKGFVGFEGFVMK